MATSVQDMVRPADCVDLYYYDGATSMKQCFATTQNTKYQQAFQTLGAGQVVFTIPPQNGIQDIVLNMGITVPAVNNCNLTGGWGYALIDQVSFRYGGSSQFFITGDQLLQQALRKQPNRSAANDLYNIGGNGTTSSSGGAQSVEASVVLALPHSLPSGVGKAHPLPTDALTQQCQVTVILKSPTTVFWGASVASAPTLLSFGNFIVQQVMLNNQGDALARRVNMADNAYAFPCEFLQQKQTIALVNSATSQSVPLTGFRSGEVKSIQIWLTNTADTPANQATNDPFFWYLPKAVEMLYAGDKYAVFSNGGGTGGGSVAQLFNLINSNKISAFDNVSTGNAANGYGTGSVPAATSYLAKWVELPFAQTFVDDDAHYMLVHGKPITNGIVNLNITTPTASGSWVLNVSYVYNATLLFSQGTADYVF
jgi:hypothetical protein